MKRILVIMLLLAMGIFFVSSNSSAMTTGYTGETALTAGIGINGTVHDLRRANTKMPSAFNSTGQADYLDRICIFCHAPHHAYKVTGTGVGTGLDSVSAAYNYLPLWNHPQTVEEFTPYFNGNGAPLATSMKGSQARDNGIQIGSASLLCLSCHDGSIAVNEYGNTDQDSRSRSTGSSLMKVVDKEYAIGKDDYLGNHHPIGFDYDMVAGFDMEILASNVAVFDHTNDFAVYGVVANTINLGAGTKPVSEVLWNGKMECSSCHAVHNTGNTGEKLLYVSDQNSNLCLSCHWKGTKTATLNTAP